MEQRAEGGSDQKWISKSFILAQHNLVGKIGKAKSCCCERQVPQDCVVSIFVR
jgi:hypothetical protein